jgi:hypothetical protein
MSNFYIDKIRPDPRFVSTDPIKDIELLEPVTRAAVRAIVEDAKAENVDLVVTETYRSSERQKQLFAEGKSRLEDVGVHHYGLAADFAKRVGTTLTWGGDWTFLIRLAGKHGLISGGDWGKPNQPHSFRDWDHVQRVTLDQQKELFTGMWYPSSELGANSGVVAPASLLSARVAPPSNLTETQQLCLDIIDTLNSQEFGGWFKRSSVMATIQVESSFQPKAFRQEPSGVASYGLMQVLDTTAGGLGLTGSPDQLYDAETGIRYGMRCLKHGWDFLASQFGRLPTLEEWCAGYNEGYGAAAKGRPDAAYVKVWMAARDHWLGFEKV